MHLYYHYVFDNHHCVCIDKQHYAAYYVMFTSFSAPSFEAFEMNNHSLLTEAILYALDNSDGKKLIHDICPTISKC